MNIHNEKLILSKLSQVETLLGVANSILSELKAELVATRAKSVQFEVFDETADQVTSDTESIPEAAELVINTASLCHFINHDVAYRSVESEVLRLIGKEVESSPRANYFISSYVKKLAERNIQNIEQLRILVAMHKPKVINHAKGIKSSTDGNGTVIFGIALYYLLNQVTW
ncbi:hypothetical protein [Photobacterium sanguinicancri]|uniref:hypothetical protein n=1 Tax=Photobacterium sanguinicancri TaxID=875932 RepID=UPI0021C4C737|nr:hypothetical protein [Photobacterium sanguinicancri]